MTSPKIPQDMLKLATKTLSNSYCPYSNFKVAACVRSKDGSLFASGNVENAAYNLCICAESNAITQMVAHGHQHIKEVLIITPTTLPTAPCGACRQRIYEFSHHHNTPIYMCTVDGESSVSSIQTLLPLAFGPQDLETK